MSRSSSKIFKSPDILEENNRDNDYLDFSSEIERLKHKLLRIEKTNFVALIAPHGAGKTTVINQLWNQLEEPTHLWMQFDAWKYPNRDDLWENFVLDFFRSFEESLFKSALQQFDGDNSSAFEEGAKAVGAGPLAYLSKIIRILSKETPIKRDFQVQELFIKLLKLSTIKDAETITIVLEDIDRSGDKGVYFLETLSYFFKKASQENDIPVFRVIVPMEENFLNIDENKRNQFGALYDSYLKVFDQTWNIDLSRANFKPFVEELFTNEVKTLIGVNELSEFFQRTSIETPRELQLHLRHVIDLYDHYVSAEEALNWDVRIVLFVELNRSKKQRFVVNNESGQISERAIAKRALELCIAEKSQRSITGNFYFIDDPKENYVVPKYYKAWAETLGEKTGFMISNKYLSLI